MNTIDLPNKIPVQTNIEIAKLCHTIYQLQMTSNENNNFDIQIHFHELIIHLQKAYNKSFLNFGIAINQSKDYIDTYYFRDIKLEDLAERANLYVEKFREYYGTPPH
ncbi:hypothetical protein [Oceanobacillus jeddahense]|uniref:Uncharacterized protein n=1 Tax=Oceanobacillus jeddahense TaxID=1462527 RepID=A0ABY5JLB6_9BACI|nr:hypothetical protein [Oceanobacillus jeddahense]UUI01094.1 hypothetical protein NP439_13585 [Oceanobacillus jeddahense]